MIVEVRSMLPLALGATAVLAGFSLLLSGDERPAAPLPAAAKEGKVSLEQVLAKRRSVRRFKGAGLTRRQIAQLCWAAQGVSDARRGLRTCPSAGALYPLELYVVTAEAVEHYVPASHAMEKHLAGDVRGKLAAAALNQEFLAKAPATFVIAAVASRTQRKYGRRAMRYVHMEVGHAAQNVLLQAQALGLGAVPVGAFEDQKVAEVLHLPKGSAPMYLIPVGVPAVH